MLQRYACVFLSRLLASPRQREAHVELSVQLPFVPHCVPDLFRKTFSFQGELALDMLYGYEAHGHEDRMINAAKTMNKFGIEKIAPGALLVNHLPFCMLCFSFHNGINLVCAPSTSLPRMVAWV
jgi:uncharacterized protein YybS (DUF2232 family)